MLVWELSLGMGTESEATAEDTITVLQRNIVSSLLIAFPFVLQNPRLDRTELDYFESFWAAKTAFRPPSQTLCHKPHPELEEWTFSRGNGLPLWSAMSISTSQLTDILTAPQDSSRLFNLNAMPHVTHCRPARAHLKQTGPFTPTRYLRKSPTWHV